MYFDRNLVKVLMHSLEYTVSFYKIHTKLLPTLGLLPPPIAWVLPHVGYWPSQAGSEYEP